MVEEWVMIGGKEEIKFVFGWEEERVGESFRKRKIDWGKGRFRLE